MDVIIEFNQNTGALTGIELVIKNQFQSDANVVAETNENGRTILNVTFSPGDEIDIYQHCRKIFEYLTMLDLEPSVIVPAEAQSKETF
jgi:undecaprenyl pyrophosphate synthase